MGCNCGGRKTSTDTTLLASATPMSDQPHGITYPDGTTGEFPNQWKATEARAVYGGRIYPLGATTTGT